MTRSGAQRRQGCDHCCRLSLAGPWAGLLAATWLAGVLPASAQQWEFQPRANVQASYEDNITLQPDDPESGLGSSLSVTALALRSRERSRLALSAGLRFNEFAENSDLNNATALFAADWSYQMPRSQFQLNQSFSTQSTLTSELATTGATDINRQQYRFRIQPGWTYRLDEVSTLSLSVSYDDVFYEDVADTPLSNYRNGSVSLSASRSLSERLSLNLATSYGLFESQDDENETENLSVQLGADYQLSETFSLSALAGLRRTRVKLIDALDRRITEDSSGPVFSLSAQKQFADGAAFRALAARELTPSGASEALDTTKLLIGYSYPINERLRFDLSSQAYRNRQLGDQPRSRFGSPLGDQTAAIDRDYADVKIGLWYQLRPSLSVVFDYSHRRQQTDEDSDSASSNRVSVSLAWRGR